MAATGDRRLGERIRAARQRAGLTQGDLVERLPSAPPRRGDKWLSSIETGYRNATPQDVAEIARALNTTTDELLLDDAAPSPLAPSLSPDESIVLFAYRHAAPQTRRSMLATARLVAEESEEYRADDPPAAGHAEAGL